jgi:beta-aspartyl-peptidase (threonine type)
LAAGTSTGGLTNKKWGRIGGVPIAGAGTFADNQSCAMSGTGTGEEFIRNSVGFQVHALMTYRKLSLKDAVAEVVDKILKEDSGGIIAVDSQGHISMRCNTPGMARAATDSRGKVEVFLAR